MNCKVERKRLIFRRIRCSGGESNDSIIPVVHRKVRKERKKSVPWRSDRSFSSPPRERSTEDELRRREMYKKCFWSHFLGI